MNMNIPVFRGNSSIIGNSIYGNETEKVHRMDVTYNLIIRTPFMTSMANIKGTLRYYDFQKKSKIQKNHKNQKSKKIRKSKFLIF